MGIASNNALFNVGHDEGVHKVPNTLGLLVAISSWTTFERKESVTMYFDIDTFNWFSRAGRDMSVCILTASLR